MDISTFGWIGLIVILVFNSFGIFWLFTSIASIIVFIFGTFSLLYLKLGDIEKFYTKCSGNPLTSNPQCEGGLKSIKRLLSSPKKTPKADNRVTGSECIDSSLQEILGYIIRDYIQSWYHIISIDKDFPNTTVRQTAQTFAINISNRVKEVDWIPFLTQRLVDDAATHLRLYKQARSKIKIQERSKDVKNSPSKDAKMSPRKNIHKRNKSETDVTWYIGKSSEFKRETEKCAGNSKFYSSESSNYTLEDYFFDLEFQMENNLVCRDSICMDRCNEKNFLNEVVEILLYILLPDDDFQCKPLRYLLRDIFANGVILPLFDLISDPDYINQVIIWICLREAQMSNDIFLTTLRLTESSEELNSTKELVEHEIHNLRSRDAGGEDLSVKQQLSSLSYVIKLIDNRLAKMDNIEIDSDNFLEQIPIENMRRINLSLEQILKDNLGLSYFMDFISTHKKKQMDLFFYLNIEGWKNSVSKELQELKKNKGSENVHTVYDMIRSTALSIYDQYLGDKKDEKIHIGADIVQHLHFKIRNLNEIPNENWFDKVQEVLFHKMENESLGQFKKSKAYIKLLHELDLVPQTITEEDALSLNSVESLEVDSSKYNQGENGALMIDRAPKIVKHTRSFSDVTMFKTENNSVQFNPYLKLNINMETPSMNTDSAKDTNENLRTGEYNLHVKIIETGIVCEKGKTFGIYALRVSWQYNTGYLEEWHIYRRYSDFYDLHTKIKEKFPDLAKLAFPGKKTFHNMDRTVLERRMKMLGHYMGELCQTHVINSHHGLKDLLMSFLEQGEYDREAGGPISATINTLVNPIKSGMKTIKNMPEHLINTVDEVVEGISKVFHSKGGKLPETSKVGASIEENDDNIPLRIMLLLMDEVFDLKSRNQWLRRRIVTLLRQIVRTMFGDIVNRRILDFVSYMTSPKNVAHYLSVFKQSFWPNGVRNDKKSERTPETKSRTRVAAKVALLSCLSDELKHIIGSETTRRGLITIFDLFQRPILNRRLLYVLLEGVLCTLFPEKDIGPLLRKLHSKSKRLNHSNFQDSTKNTLLFATVFEDFLF
ncbi:sorting nexin-13-like isoform X2 [Rhynchophorus ferrugineus]|uniref:sorting nexin-13-like isoform X2 n=1 Tax=Rhynchophorus ferrugineus TaxID=354439 RepID=UPI003FCE1411